MHKTEVYGNKNKNEKERKIPFVQKCQKNKAFCLWLPMKEGERGQYVIE